MESKKIAIGDLTYTVRAQGEKVEVVRTGFALLPDRNTIVDEMAIASEKATGCKVVKDSFVGDIAIGRFDLHCD